MAKPKRQQQQPTILFANLKSVYKDQNKLKYRSGIKLLRIAKNSMSWVVTIIKLHFVGLWHRKDKEESIGQKINNSNEK